MVNGRYTHPLLRMGAADPGVYECGEGCEGDAHFHDPDSATFPELHVEGPTGK